MFDPQYEITTEPQPNDEFFGLPNQFLILDDDQDQEIVEGLLDAAVDWAEMWTGSVLRLTSFTARFPCLQTDFHRLNQARPFISIDRMPLVDIVEVRVFEQDNPSATVVLPTLVRNYAGASNVFLPKGFNPTLDEDVDYPVEIDFRAGYSNAPANDPLILLPPSVRIGIQQHCSFMFENRGDVGTDEESGVPQIVKNSYAPIKIVRGLR